MPDPDLKSLDNHIQQIASSAQTDDEAFRAWHRVFDEGVGFPCAGFVIGEPISVVEFGYDGNPRRGLTARCRRADETTHVVAACDVVLLPGSVEPFDGLLPWGFIDNRPFLRCLHGFGLCCWRLGRFDEAERVFQRVLWLNPSDNQGARFLIDAVRARDPWEAEKM